MKGFVYHLENSMLADLLIVGNWDWEFPCERLSSISIKTFRSHFGLYSFVLLEIGIEMSLKLYSGNDKNGGILMSGSYYVKKKEKEEKEYPWLFVLHSLQSGEVQAAKIKSGCFTPPTFKMAC